MSHDLLDLPPVVLRSKVVDQTVPRDDTIADHVVVLRSEAVRQMAEEEIVVVGRIVVLEEAVHMTAVRMLGSVVVGPFVNAACTSGNLSCFKISACESYIYWLQAA